MHGVPQLLLANMEDSERTIPQYTVVLRVNATPPFFDDFTGTNGLRLQLRLQMHLVDAFWWMEKRSGGEGEEGEEPRGQSLGCANRCMREWQIIGQVLIPAQP